MACRFAYLFSASVSVQSVAGPAAADNPPYFPVVAAPTQDEIRNVKHFSRFADAIFGARFKEKVQQSILGIEDKEILAQFARVRFVAAKDDGFRQPDEIAYTLERLN